jgi:WD40 repeat protein/lipoprotein NlpI
LAAAKPLHLFGTNLNLVRCAQFSADGRLLALGGSDGSAVVWELASTQQTQLSSLHSGPINHLEFSPDAKRLVIASGDSWARVWDFTTKRCISQMAHQGPVAYASFTPDGKQVVTATVNCPQALLDDKEWSGWLADPRAGLYAVSNAVQLWDAETGKLSAPPLHIPPAASLVSFSPDRSRVVNSCSLVKEGEDAAYLERGRTEVYIREVKSGRKLSPALYLGSPDCVYAGFSPDGAKLVTTSIERTAQVWDGYTGKPAGPVLQHGHEVRHASFSPDRSLIATASRDGTVRIWETGTGDLVGPPLNHRFTDRNPPFEAPVRVFFAPDGQYLVSCASDRKTYVWELTRELHSLADDLLMAELLANARIDETGTLAPLGVNLRADLESQWRRLLIRYPTTLGVSPEQLLVGNSARKQRRAREAQEYYHRAHVKERAGKFSDAIKDLSQAIALNPDYDWALKKRGQVFLLLDEYGKAAADFQTAIERFPDFPYGYSELAWLYVVGPKAFRNPEKALPLALRGVELSKDWCDQLNTLGVVYYRLGEVDKAIETLKKSASGCRPGTTAYDYFFLAMAYSRLGQTAQAEEFYAKAVESWKNHPESFNPLNQRELQEVSAEAEEEIQKLKRKQQRDGGP